MKNNKRKSGKKKWIVAVCIVGGLAVAGVFGYRYMQSKKVVDEPMGMMTDFVIRTDIENTYSAKGYVISAQQSIANSILPGTSYPVKDVLVQVGDMVKAGDPLYTLNMSELENDILLQESKKELQQQTNAIDAGAANRAVYNAQASSGYSYVESTTGLIRHAEDTNLALIDEVKTEEDLNRYMQAESVAWNNYMNYKQLHDQADSTSREKQDTITEIKLAINDVTYDSELTEEKRIEKLNELNYQLQEATLKSSAYEREHSDISQKYTEAKADYDTAKANREAAEKALEANKKTVRQEVRDLEDKGMEVNRTNLEVLEQEAKAKDSAAKQQISGKSGLLEIEDSIRRSRQKLENGTVYAGSDGMVTAVNIQPGLTYTGTSAVVINNVEEMKIVADIEEGHIADLYVGMPVRVTTDSTGSESIRGKVTFTAATPVTDTHETQQNNNTNNNNANTRSTTANQKVKYRVEITPDDPIDRLRIGMNARIEFILESAENCLAVPKSAVVSDGVNGFVTRVDGFAEMEGTERPTTEVRVSVGISNDFYTQITDDSLKEGDEVRLPMYENTYSDNDMLAGIY